MCLQCHNAMSDGEVRDSVEAELREPHFDQWNTTSLSHILIAACGRNGETVSKLAIELLDTFSKWYNITRNDGYLPSTGVEPMPSKQCIINICNYLHNKENVYTIDTFSNHLLMIGYICQPMHKKLINMITLCAKIIWKIIYYIIRSFFWMLW